ncbi:MAG: leucine-rich repeat domain-containing protein [Muribaculaceae bacterium]|nr:leucine-rich repeat domain-containing protein [Muribaculaceae bacterium]
MKKNRFILFLMLLSCSVAICFASNAQSRDTDKKRSFLRGDVLEIDLREAGTLYQYLSTDEQKRVRCIRLNGVMNSDDAWFIRKICNRSGACDENGRNVDNYLDLELDRVRIVGGGSNSNRSEHDVISKGMFKSCDCLRYVYLPRDVRLIGDEAFYNCTKLEEVRFVGRSKVRSIGNEAFRNCHNLTRINLPESVESLGDQCFSGCSNLRRIELPSTLLSIGNEAFSDVPLTSIKLPGGLTFMGSKAFDDTKITSLYLPKYLEVENGDFGSLPKLKEFQVERGNRYYTVEDGVLYDIKGTTLLCYPKAKTGAFTVPSGVTALQHDAFAGNSSISSVTFPNSLQSIGSKAFYNCTSLRKVVIPESVTSIEASAFSGCSKMSTATINAAIKSLSSNAFRDCGALQSVVLPLSLEKIGDSAFENCKSLQDVEFGNYLAVIEKEAFKKCGFVQLELPEGINKIGENAFRDCKQMTTIILPSNLNVLEKELFRGCERLVSVSLPSQLTTIGENAFRDCKQLPSVELPEGLTTIANNAFRGTSLTLLTLPASIQSLGEKIVEKCKMQSITCLAVTPPALKKISEKKTPLYVPASSVEAYKRAKSWKDFKNILPIE